MSGAFFCLVLSSLLDGSEVGLRNLGFQAGSLTGWEGQGFQIFCIPATDGKKNRYVATSKDNADNGHKAILHRAFLLPPSPSVIRFKAGAVRAPGCGQDPNLDIVLVTPGRRIMHKMIQTADGYRDSPGLQEAPEGQGREYIWRVAAYAGQYVRIAMVDEDERPGCYVHVEGFEVLSENAFETEEFSKAIAQLRESAKLAPFVRYESKNFLALSNAEESLNSACLRECELIYACFWDHFLKKGFELHEPDGRLMLAVFDTRAGFEAYLGHEVTPLFSGIYQRATNRFVTYDFGQNELLLEAKRDAARTVRGIESQIIRQRSLASINRWANERRGDVNVATMMHEVAHQLSFNCGMLNRDGDVPGWLAEGLACYCEATQDSSWQGIGAVSPERALPLAAAVQQGRKLFSLRKLVGGDDWLKHRSGEENVLLGYAQSWALFRMLVEEQPRDVCAYLSRIHTRLTPDHRLDDFEETFGHDLAKLQDRHEDYVSNLVRLLPRTRR